MNPRHLTLHQLRIFHAVAQHGSFARAAEALHLAPPTLSLQVKQLAGTVGQPLVEQIGRRIYLTAAGHALAQAAADVEERLRRLAEDIAALQGIEKGSVRLAILTTVKYVVPKLLGSFAAAHPGIEVAMVVGNRDALLQRLAANQDDLYILGQPPQEWDVVSEPFADNPLVLVAPPDHPLARERAIDPRRLEGEPFILREPGSGTRATMQRFFDALGVRVRARLEVGSNEAIKQTVAGGLGLAVLSAHTVAAELALGELVQLDVQGFPLLRQWHVVYPRGKRLSPAAAAFKDWLYAHRGQASAPARRPPAARRARGRSGAPASTAP
ncbi:HTH-type transcriptional activator CmpR [Tepidimonas sediminis]|uniref:HTH-type transcriptional activator CmpR n=1 Tax=Tepidimonas sediminis TaxID=2588941 RepID=A0A554WS52_9BURK|nr:LysR family transcriptional regulator [Tepidimonas sediminis]TSE26407.1 HTH-type transcriptional activator CmpR [Tepidimonas sediminis]